MFVACESCDLLYRGRPLARGQKARCARCGDRLYGSAVDSLERTLAYTVAALVMWIAANAFPFLRFSLEGQVQENRIWTGVQDLWMAGFEPLASLVLLTTIAAPLCEIVLHLWVLTALVAGVRVPGLADAARATTQIARLSMLEVYLLAVIVAVVKLSMMARVQLDVGAFAFFGLLVVLTLARSSLETEALWQRWEEIR